MKPIATTVLELAGGIAIAIGIGMIFLPAGLIAAGVMAIGLSYFAERGRR